MTTATQLGAVMLLAALCAAWLVRAAWRGVSVFQDPGLPPSKPHNYMRAPEKAYSAQACSWGRPAEWHRFDGGLVGDRCCCSAMEIAEVRGARTAVSADRLCGHTEPIEDCKWCLPDLDAIHAMGDR